MQNETKNSLFDALTQPFKSAVDTLSGAENPQQKQPLEMAPLDITGEIRTPKVENKVESTMPEPQISPVDSLLTNLSNARDMVSEAGQDMGANVNQAVEKVKGITDTYPNFWAGAAPLLMGAVLGDVATGAKVGSENLYAIDKRDSENQILQRKAAQKAKEGSVKPLTTSNTMIMEGIDGSPIVKRVEDSIGGTPFGADKFYLNQKKQLAEFNDRIKNKSGIDFNTEQKLRKEYSLDPITKASKDISMSFNKIQDIATAPQNGANDISLIFQYMKMLDPASTVREGEQATAKNSGSIPDSVGLAYNRLLKGDDKILPSAVRTNFFKEARRIYEGQKRVQSQVDERYGSLASQYNLEPKRVSGIGANIKVNKNIGQDQSYNLVEQNGWIYLKSPDGEYEPLRQVGK